MEHMKAETIRNLARSFAGESQARARYDIYAATARQENQEWIARIFDETAKNEQIHAEQFLNMLKQLGTDTENLEITAGYPYALGSTSDNLGFAADGEAQEHDRIYPEFAELARREGYPAAAQLWQNIAVIEGVHHNTFLSLKQQLDGGSLTKKKQPIVWRCLNCGYTYESADACEPCPVCGKSAFWQEGTLNQKDLSGK